MIRIGLGIAGLLFGVFLLNVSFGALRRPVFLSDIQEMLLLLASVLAFVVAVLAIERAAVRRVKRAASEEALAAQTGEQRAK